MSERASAGELDAEFWRGVREAEEFFMGEAKVQRAMQGSSRATVSPRMWSFQTLRKLRCEVPEEPSCRSSDLSNSSWLRVSPRRTGCAIWQTFLS